MIHKLGKFDWCGKLIDNESWLMRKIDWWGKFIDGESSLMRKVDWWGKLIDEESWLMRKVDWWGKLIDGKFIDKEIWLTSKFGWRWKQLKSKLVHMKQCRCFILKSRTVSCKKFYKTPRSPPNLYSMSNLYQLNATETDNAAFNLEQFQKF